MRPLFPAGGAPLGVGGLLDGAVELVRRHALLLWGGAALLSVPAELLRLSVLRGRAPDLSRLADLPWFSLYGMLGMLVQVALLPLTAALASAECGGRVDSPWRLAYGRPLSLCVLALPMLGAALLSAGGCPCFVPGIFVAFVLCVAPAALVLEGRNPIEACARALSLSRGGMGRWFAWWSVVWAADASLQMGVGQLADPLVRAQVLELLPLDARFYDLCAALVAAPLLGLGKALAASACALWYFEQRSRLEGTHAQVAA